MLWTIILVEAIISTVLISFMVLVSRPASRATRWFHVSTLLLLVPVVLILVVLTFALFPRVVLVGVLEAVAVILHVIVICLFICIIVEFSRTVIFV